MEVEGKKKQHFLLVHGACHGAWNWYGLVTKLRSDGYRVTALDMASGGVNPKRVEEIRSVVDYCQPLLEFLTDLPAGEKVVIVGHSFGGGCISLAMEKFPHKISVAVFVTALMPGPSLPFTTVSDEANNAVGSFMDTQYFYGDGPTTPQPPIFSAPRFDSWTLTGETNECICGIRSVERSPLSKENYGSVRRVFVVCDQDKAIKPEIQKWMIENNPPDGVKELATKPRGDGYRVTALDMASAGVNRKRVEEIRCFYDYCQPLLEFLMDSPPREKVIPVSHSMGGVCISLAMEKFP
ncbi:Polyneuridine-aldehyde esterase [Sesamum angolense]|uniref:Polyneuridine-aldehyde esterase n=1 Tax=Sesamum angolense TaxID=2727404 RepID=A0AAE2BPZ3_9LAMI|nr:Polyneuridine-aldehyde esterase [Sesamum angolense]